MHDCITGIVASLAGLIGLAGLAGLHVSVSLGLVAVSVYLRIRVSASVCTRVSSIGKSCAAYGSVFL